MNKLTKSQASQIRALQQMKDKDVDFTDIPLTLDWSKIARFEAKRNVWQEVLEGVKEIKAGGGRKLPAKPPLRKPSGR